MKTFLILVGLSACLAMNVYAQTWQFTGSLNTERRQETINVLQNGKVLVTGGDDMAGNALASCELFDPATATWSYAAPMRIQRERHTSNELPDGRIVVIGGNTNNTYDNVVTASIEIYDPTTDSWVDGGMLQAGRQNHTSTLLNDSLILVSAGLTSEGCTTECEIYNVNSHQSAVTGSMYQLRHDQSATLLSNGTVLVSGGRTGGAGSDYLSECEIFNPSTNSWTVASPLPESCIGAMTEVFSDNSVIIAGGRKDANNPAEAAEVYTPGTGVWTSVQNIMVPAEWQAGTVLPGDRLLMTGGIMGGDWSDPSGQSPINTPTCEWYDKSNARWFYAPTMHEARSEHGAVTLTQNVNTDLPPQLVLVVGGFIGMSNVTNTCEVLDVGSSALTYYMAHQESVASVTAPNTSANSLEVIYGDNGTAVKLTLATTETAETELVSIGGSVVFDINEPLSAGEHTLAIPANIPAGTYLLRVVAGENIMNTKLLVTR